MKHPAAQVSPSPHCQVTLTVQPETSSGGHKVKLSAAMVSDAFGPGGWGNGAAMNEVYNNVASKKKSVFSID
jgi:hypothetical protein